MADPSFVQVAPDGSGKKIRNLQLDVVQPDGTTATVQMQVVNMVDENGQQYNFGAPLDVADNDVRQLLHRVVELLEQIHLEVVDENS